MPEPLRVPLSETLVGIVGALPRGKKQVLFTVTVPPLLNVTELKDTLLHESVAVEVLSITIVPPLALNVGLPEMVRLARKLNIPLGALNVPPEMVSVLLICESEPSVTVPELSVKVPVKCVGLGPVKEPELIVVLPTQNVE